MKGIARREAGVPHKGKGVGKKKEAEKSRRKRGSVSYKGKGAARGVEKELRGGFEKES